MKKKEISLRSYYDVIYKLYGIIYDLSMITKKYRLGMLTYNYRKEQEIKESLQTISKKN